MKKFSAAEALSSPDELKTFFDKYGFLHIGQFYEPTLCQSAQKAIEDYEKELVESNKVELVTETIDNHCFIKYWQGIFGVNQSFRKFLNYRLMSLGSILLSTDNIYYSDLEAHIRNPGGSEIPKHQDNFYFNLKNASGMTVYIALTPHNSSSGGLNYKVKSHEKVVDHSLSKVEGFSSFIEDSQLDKEVVDSGIYSPDYSVGDISIHHPNNEHWSNPAPANALGRGFALSARLFDSQELIDEKGVERYKRLLTKNRTF